MILDDACVRYANCSGRSPERLGYKHRYKYMESFGTIDCRQAIVVFKFYEYRYATGKNPSGYYPSPR